MIIAIDFDGTCVTHDYPEIGLDIGAIPVLKELIENDHELILLTMRSDRDSTLEDAKKWFADNDIELWSANINPEQKSWTDSSKAYAHLYIDDAALGAPVKVDYELSDRPFIDWGSARKMLVNLKVIKEKISYEKC